MRCSWQWGALPLAAALVVASSAPLLDRCTEMHFEQTIDHFSGAPAQRWLQRYFVCEPTWWKAPDGPIFFYTGNEAPVEEYVNNTGLMWENAQEQGALLVFAEHRFFGKSWPFGTEEESRKHLDVLTYDQALADYAVLLTSIKQQHGPSCCPAISFGGSYGAELTFGFRAKYPWVVDGALVASGPLLQDIGQDPLGEARVMTETTRTLAGSGCVDSFRAAFAEVTEILTNGSASDRQQLAHDLRLCTVPEAGPASLQMLRDWFQTAIVYYTLGSYPFPSSYMTLGVKDLPPYPMRPVCKALQAGNGTEDSKAANAPRSLMPGLASAMAIYYNLTGEAHCFDPSTQPRWAAIAPLCGFVVCREEPSAGSFAADGVNDMFWDQRPQNLSEIQASCKAQWGWSRVADASSALDASAVTYLLAFSNMQQQC